MLGYVRAVRATDAAVRTAMPSLGRLADFHGLVRARRISRSGRVGAYAYEVHGAGCRFVSDDGTEIDVDFDFAADGSEVFDPWRLRHHGLGLPEPVDVPERDLLSAARSLRPLLTEVRPGWFGVRAGADPRVGAVPGGLSP
ncbi:DUF6896 domain-containing protein [Streptomyces hydrogenans]|uniref:DUF6896 domain-containing protein n=1 Tax=Streptomyces hydrogenans TaxID=1873719 RepID=UPI003818D2AA